MKFFFIKIQNLFAAKKLGKILKILKNSKNYSCLLIPNMRIMPTCVSVSCLYMLCVVSTLLTVHTMSCLRRWKSNMTRHIICITWRVLAHRVMLCRPQHISYHIVCWHAVYFLELYLQYNSWWCFADDKLFWLFNLFNLHENKCERLACYDMSTNLMNYS